MKTQFKKHRKFEYVKIGPEHSDFVVFEIFWCLLIVKWLNCMVDYESYVSVQFYGWKKLAYVMV